MVNVVSQSSPTLSANSPLNQASLPIARPHLAMSLLRVSMTAEQIHSQSECFRQYGQHIGHSWLLVSAWAFQAISLFPSNPTRVVVNIEPQSSCQMQHLVMCNHSRCIIASELTSNERQAFRLSSPALLWIFLSLSGYTSVLCLIRLAVGRPRKCFN